ncbi:MAG: ATP-dependent 6-phosphofructokinase [Planctomycetota bacterium]
MHIMINTGGGDAPGLNAVIRAATLSAIRRGWKVTGIRKGYSGLLSDEPGGLIPLSRESVRGIAAMGGTMLGTINKGNPFEYPSATPDGKTILADISDRVIDRFKATGADALIAVGGDGSMRIAQRFVEKGMPVVCVPKTIDNDVSCTTVTFGFDSAVSVATEAIDRLTSTAEAHERVFVVEVMGRYAGWIALHSGIAGNAHVILMPEIPFSIDAVCKSLEHRYATKRRWGLVIVAEGATPVGGSMATVGTELGREVRLGGIAEQVAKAINERTGIETRSLVLGHLQRGGSPTTFDRLIALRYGAAAIRMVEEKKFGCMVGFTPSRMEAIPIKMAISVMKSVPLDGDTVATARDLGICLGE